ncbi:hypothetical protein [Arthrobacter sp. 24S4-2]|uniref:hypothetical protein n=1 Tax=Arthrobacter sp. 24S4-2 TaxID=2575374 RepID=UPI00158612C3|nr:hypothetical protein [Arthrobacter sp. 24S4-2]
MGEVHGNIMGLAMVEAAMASASTGRRIILQDLLEESYQQAQADETNPDVLEVLQSWASASAWLTGTPHMGPSSPAHHQPTSSLSSSARGNADELFSPREPGERRTDCTVMGGGWCPRLFCATR